MISSVIKYLLQAFKNEVTVFSINSASLLFKYEVPEAENSSSPVTW